MPEKGNFVWQAQPRWVRLLTVWVALPAWLYMVIAMVSGSVSVVGTELACAVMAAVACIQLFFVVRREGFLD